MNTNRKSMRTAVRGLLLVVTVASLVAASAAENVKPATTIAQLAGPWQIALVGSTGCGQTAMLFTGTLDSSGTAEGTLTGSGGCGASSSTQTFKITSLESNGSGTATLSCGSACGWGFNIQVAASKQVFNLVDVVNSPGDVLAGSAVKQ
jgi:hypothetical protein